MKKILVFMGVVAIAMGGDFNKVIGVKAHTVPVDSVIKDLREVD